MKAICTTLQNILQLWIPRIYCAYEKFHSVAHSGLLNFVTHLLTNATKNFQLMPTIFFSNSSHFNLVQRRRLAYLCTRSNIVQVLPVSFAARVWISLLNASRTCSWSALDVLQQYEFQCVRLGLDNTHKRKIFRAISRQMFQ